MPALVLIAESDPFNLRLLQEVCEAAGHTVLTAMEGTSALDVVARKRPDLVMVDVALAATSFGALDGNDPTGGLEVLRVLKADLTLSSIPVLLTTSAADSDAGRRGIELGADDYLSRPYRIFEIHQRVRNTLRRAWLERLSTGEEGLDPLTRAGSAVQLPITLDYEMTRAVRFDHPLSCVAIEVANLDGLLDAVGPQRVEGLLGELAASVRQCIRGIDHLFRASDRELVLVLPETASAEAQVVITRLRERAHHGTLVGSGGRVTPQLLVGVAGRVESAVAGADGLLRAARINLHPLG
jgi:two-component system cell cycle response regulator